MSSTDTIAPAGTPPAAPAPPTTAPPLPHLTRGDLWASFWRFFFTFEISWNYERMQALGFMYAMEPILRRLFPNRDDYEEALARHLTFFNTSVIVGAPLILGSAVAMEEAGAPESAQGMKVALMGPMAGIGDSITYALYNSIIVTIGAAWALQQNILGPIFVVVMVAVPYSLARYFQYFGAYRAGRQLAGQLVSGTLARLTEGATVLGLVVFGGFIPSIVKLVTTVSYTQHLTVNGKAVTETLPLQTTLDSILPYALPVAVTAAVYFLLKRYNLNPIWAILGVAAFGLLFGWLGWFAPVLPTK